MDVLDRLARPLLKHLDPEDAHRLAIRGLQFARPGRHSHHPSLRVRAFGIDFPNPVGLAAGFDKNAEAPDVLLRVGFGFVEIGTVTPRPQAGNPRPRLFRLERDQAVINRLGFNSEGSEAVIRRLAKRAGAPGIVGVNVGANRDSADRSGDYVQLVEAFAPYASYFTINISSPNTPGLRDLQYAAALDDLLARVLAARDAAAAAVGRKPLLVKIAPDLSLPELDDVVGIARRRGVDGMIIGNTTIRRPPSLREQAIATEAGGLSGRPLFALANRVLAETFMRVESAFPLVGAGGIVSGDDAVAKMRAGASLVQLYSGLVFGGLGLVRDMEQALISAARTEPLGALVGRDAHNLTTRSWPE